MENIEKAKNLYASGIKDFELIFKSLKACINTTDLNGVFTSWSEQSTEYFGYTSEEAVGKLRNSDVHASQEEALKVLKSVNEKGIFNGVVTLARKDGSLHPNHLIVTKMYDEKGNLIGYTGISFDIPVELKERDDILSKNYQLQAIHEIVSLTSSSFTLSEILQKALDKILDFSKMDGGVIFLFSEDGEKLIARHSQGFSPEFVEGVKEILISEGMTGQAIKFNRPVSLDTQNYPTKRLLPFIEKEGLVSHVSIPLISVDKPVGVMNLSSKKPRRFSFDEFSFFEIVGKHMGTAIEKAILYKDIKNHVKSYQDMYENAPDIYLTMDMNGKIINCNKKALAILHFNKKNDLIGKSIFDIVEPEFHEKARNAFKNIVNEGFLNNFECRWVASNNNRLNVVVNSKLEKNKKEIYCIARDLTAWEKIHETLLNSQKIDLLAELSKGFAHDFNNILSGILGYATFISSIISPDDKIAQYVHNIETSALRGADFTQKLLTFSMSTKLKITNFDLNDALLNALEILSKSLQKNISIEKKLSKTPLYIDGDRAAIQQALFNIMLNAFEAMDKGGTLFIETKEEKVEGEKVAVVPGSLIGDTVCIVIRDTGCGIPYEIHHRILEPFFTTKQEDSKTGLGLAMVYRVVKKHNGHISFESELSKGTTFTIYFPKAQKMVEQAEIASARKGREGVLVADDEDIIRMLAKDILELKGYHVYLACNGQEAVDIYRKNHDNIHIVVLDIIMPVLDGEGAFSKLKEINPDVRVLIASGYTKSEKVQKIISSGGKGFLQKPFQVEELVGAIRLILDS